MNESRESQTQHLIGGELCLDFANTLNGHGRMPQHEYLHDYRDLVLWGHHAAALKPDEVPGLLGEAELHPAEAHAVYRRSLDLREAIFRIATSLAGGDCAKDADLERLNTAWREGQEHACLVRSGSGFSLGWDDAPCLDQILRPVVASAIQLLTSPRVHQLRVCAGDRCDWLFVDGSRNHLRRWCSMDECGNRAKMQRRQTRQKHSPAGG